MGWGFVGLILYFLFFLFIYGARVSDSITGFSRKVMVCFVVLSGPSMKFVIVEYCLLWYVGFCLGVFVGGDVVLFWCPMRVCCICLGDLRMICLGFMFSCFVLFGGDFFVFIGRKNVVILVLLRSVFI